MRYAIAYIAVPLVFLLLCVLLHLDYGRVTRLGFCLGPSCEQIAWVKYDDLTCRSLKRIMC